MDTTKWDQETKKGRVEYHIRQWDEPYRSTMAFIDWLEKEGVLKNSSNGDLVLDMCCGSGANTFYMAKRFPHTSFVGIDISLELVSFAREMLQKKEPDYFKRNTNLTFDVGDLYTYTNVGRSVTGITMIQSLSWLPDFEEPIRKFAGLNPDWIGITSLFYDGDVNAKIEIEDYTRDVKTFYNTYAIPKVKNLFEELGYHLSYVPFEIDKDIPKPQHTGMNTYTVKTEEGKRLQISGPLLMNWFFLLARK